MIEKYNQIILNNLTFEFTQHEYFTFFSTPKCISVRALTVDTVHSIHHIKYFSRTKFHLCSNTKTFKIHLEFINCNKQDLNLLSYVHNQTYIKLHVRSEVCSQ